MQLITFIAGYIAFIVTEAYRVFVPRHCARCKVIILHDDCLCATCRDIEVQDIIDQCYGGCRACYNLSVRDNNGAFVTRLCDSCQAAVEAEYGVDVEMTECCHCGVECSSHLCLACAEFLASES